MGLDVNCMSDPEDADTCALLHLHVSDLASAAPFVMPAQQCISACIDQLILGQEQLLFAWPCMAVSMQKPVLRIRPAQATSIRGLSGLQLCQVSPYLFFLSSPANGPVPKRVRTSMESGPRHSITAGSCSDHCSLQGRRNIIMGHHLSAIYPTVQKISVPCKISCAKHMLSRINWIASSAQPSLAARSTSYGPSAFGLR